VASRDACTRKGPARTGRRKTAAHALAALENPERGFITSDFFGTNVSPKALYDRRAAEVALEKRDIMEVTAKTDLGRVRTTNEDRLLVDESLGLFVVADGMGGRAGGEVASALAVETITASVREYRTGLQPAVQTAAVLHAAIRAADEAVWTTGRTASGEAWAPRWCWPSVKGINSTLAMWGIAGHISSTMRNCVS
jgi:hypothetical protein